MVINVPSQSRSQLETCQYGIIGPVQSVTDVTVRSYCSKAIDNGQGLGSGKRGEEEIMLTLGAYGRTGS